MNRIANIEQVTHMVDAADFALVACMRHSLITLAWDGEGGHHFIPTRYGADCIYKGIMSQKMEHAVSGASEDADGNPRPIPNEEYWNEASPLFSRELNKN